MSRSDIRGEDGAAAIYRQTDRVGNVLSDQAVIALENARLLSMNCINAQTTFQALQQQMATTEVSRLSAVRLWFASLVLRTLIEIGRAALRCWTVQYSLSRGRSVLSRRGLRLFSNFIKIIRMFRVTSGTKDRPLDGACWKAKSLPILADVLNDLFMADCAQRYGDFRTILGVPMLGGHTNRRACPNAIGSAAVYGRADEESSSPLPIRRPSLW